MRSLFPALFLALAAATASAESMQRLTDADKESFTAKDGTVLQYALTAPEDPKLGKRYPLVIFLHGAGGMKPPGERNPQRAWDGAGQFFETNTNACYFFMPQATAIWSGVPWDRLPYAMSAEPEKQPNQAVIECIEALLKDKKLAIDPDRVYLVGVSMGSMGMWDLACRRPELFAAAISCCGGYDASQAPKLAKIKFRMFHGEADNIVPEAGSRAMFDALKAAGAEVDYHVYPGANHFIWEQTYRNAATADWLFAQRRPSAKGGLAGQPATSRDLALDANRPLRRWTAKSGGTLEARLLQKRGSKVILEGQDGQKKSIEVRSLSQSDQDYVASLEAEAQ